MERPKILKVENVRDRVRGGYFPEFYAVNFGSPVWYSTELLPCSFCRARNKKYMIYQTSKNKNILYCLDCLGLLRVEAELKKYRSRKIGIKLIQDV